VLTTVKIWPSSDQLFTCVAKWKTVACNDRRSMQVDKCTSENEHVKYLVTLKLSSKTKNFSVEDRNARLKIWRDANMEQWWAFPNHEQDLNPNLSTFRDSIWTLKLWVKRSQFDLKFNWDHHPTSSSHASPNDKAAARLPEQNGMHETSKNTFALDEV